MNIGYNDSFMKHLAYLYFKNRVKCRPQLLTGKKKYISFVYTEKSTELVILMAI